MIENLTSLKISGCNLSFQTLSLKAKFDQKADSNELLSNLLEITFDDSQLLYHTI
jgi:hypothetical protein